MKKRHLVLTAILIAAMILAGCSKSASDNGGSYSSSSSVSRPTNAAMPAEANMDTEYYGGMVAEQKSADYGDFSGDTGSSAANPSISGRKLIKNVYMYIETLEFEQSRQTVEGLVRTFGGYVESSSVADRSMYNGRSLRYASYVLRIPGEQLDAFLNSSGDIGTITSQEMGTEDVTLAYVDLEAKTQSLEIQQERLLEFLEKAETIEDVIKLEDRLNTVRYQLEAQKSQLKNYDNLVAFSTVSINLQEVQRVTVPEPETVGERITSGFGETMYDLSESFKNFLVGFIVNLPYILIWGVIIFLVIFFGIRIVRKNKKRKAEQAAQAQAGWIASQNSSGYAAPTTSAPDRADTNSNTDNR